ncbi:hypothetical protein E1B28_008563 [Marasmius oreades]|uniref:DUF974-domain-containing protein n=1 Tax=Marasmius oreades TaxID=181124 RepID=A0A9P7USI1_9AGAR|nr:uncharacterized protein E1B28_008563 [Marasmius oreades]KAG7092195.1 hypothetical protein E1B28_008563 [Marasmius oreades]
MASTNGSTAHLLSLKVMRVSRPAIASAWQPFYSSSPSFSVHSTQSILSLQGKAPLPGHPKTLRDLTHATELLTLPSSFGSIQLGETFSSCLSVNNESAADVEATTLKVEMQTATSKLTLAEFGGPNFRLSSGDTLEDVVHHEIKELGQHVLGCTVSYRTPNIQHSSVIPEDGSDPSIVSFRKFYKFVVTNPLFVKTKVHTPRSPSALSRPEEREKIFLEVHIQNTAPDPIWFERLRFEAVEEWNVQETESANQEHESGGLFSGSIALMQPQDMRQYIYTLSPTVTPLEPIIHAPGTTLPLGRLDLSWRSSFGEPGRLLTSMLSRRIPLPPQPTQTPASALPLYLKRGAVPSSTPTRPRSPQLPQSRPSSPTPISNQRPSSPLPLRNRTQSIVSTRTQSPPPPPIPPEQPHSTNIEANLVVRDIPRDSICVGDAFSISFTLILSSLLPPERRGQNIRLALILQHTFAQHDINAVTSSKPPLEASTPKAASPGYSTPSPVYSTFNYALAYQKLASSSSRTQVTFTQNDGETTPRTSADKGTALPFPHYDPDDPKRRQVTGGVTFAGSSAMSLPFIELTEERPDPHNGDPPENPVQSRVYATHNFELSFVPLRKGFHNVGGLRLLLTEETYATREKTNDRLSELKAFGSSEPQILKDWDVVAEVWVS